MTTRPTQYASRLARFALRLTLFAVLVVPAKAQPTAELLDAMVEAHARDGYDLYRELLAIPNDAQVGPAHLEPNVAWSEAAFRARGFETQRLATDGFPLLLAERRAPGADKTVLIYLQLDGQPVDPSAWQQPDPYQPVLKTREGDDWRIIPWDRLDGDVNPDWRVLARSASDAKGPVAAFLTALDIAEAEGLAATHHMKVIMDFEEELGSPFLPAAVARHRDALAADWLIIYDGPRHPSNKPTLTFGARGIATVTLTVFGPRVPQHSGHYGNYVPNPAVRLARLIASMKDEGGRVTIPGFYDGVTLDDETRAILAAVPDDEPQIRADIGIAQPDAVGLTLQEAIQYPSLNVRGMRSGWVGDEVRTIVPATAVAEIDVRLVPEVDAERLLALMRQHIQLQGYHIVEETPTEAEREAHPRLIAFASTIAYQAFRTPYESGVGQWLNGALTRAFGAAPIRKRMSGGSIPISPFVTTLGIPAVTVPTVNPDNNQHSPNENLRLGNFDQAIKTFLAILTEPIPTDSN